MVLENFHGDIPRGLRAADELLKLYGRWAIGGHHRRRCGSLEGRYNAPPNEDDRHPQEEQMAPLDAMAVQRALARVPDLERIVLAILYVPNRLPPAAQLRILRIPAKLCRIRQLAGLRMFDNLYRIAVNSAHLTRRQ